METKQYFSLVSNRIKELESELKEKNNTLEIDFIKGKIKYLKEIELLPIYISVSSLSRAEIIEMETKKNISFNELLRKLHIDKVADVMKRNKIVTLSYLKEAFVNDFNSLEELLKLQESNYNSSKTISLLYNGDKNSMAQLRIASNRLDTYEENLNKEIDNLRDDYSLDNIKEIKSYLNSNSKLSREFILKHKDKIISNDPDMEKIVSKLTRKKKFSFLSKIFGNKRNKNEKKCLDNIVNFYQNDDRLINMNVKARENVFDMENYKIKKLVKKLNKEINFKKSEVNDIRNNINNTKENTLKSIKYYSNLKEDNYNKFVSLVKSKFNFVPKMDIEQLWNEPNLKESMMRVSCIKEEKELVSNLSNWNHSHKEDLEYLEEINSENYSKKLIA